MKNIKNISMALMLLAGTTLTGCSDFLDGSKQNRSNIDESQITAEQRRNQAFSAVKSIYDGGDLLKMFVKGTDIYINQSGDASGAEFYAYQLTASTAEVKSLYEKLYDVINNCNGAISDGEKSDGFDIVECDARFMRALCYYNLIQQFGDVPLCKQAITTAERNYPRTPVKEIYDFLLSDLKKIYATGNMDLTNHEGHASTASVAALISKIALAAGWDCEVTVTNKAKGTYSFSAENDTCGYFKMAKEYAQYAINDAGGESSLCSTYENKWYPSSDVNPEELFSIQFSRSVSAADGTEASAGNQWWNGFGGYYGAATDGVKLMNHQDNPNKKMLALYTEGDTRFDATFMTSIFSGKDWTTGGYMAYYTRPGSRNDMPIKYRFLPPYYTYEQMQADFESHKQQYVEGECTVIRLGDKVTAYKCTATTESVPAESSLTTDEYYTNTGNLSYTGYLKKFNGGTYTGIACKKWDDPDIDNSSVKTQGYRNVMLLSLSEVFLMKAEAEMMLGEDYLTDINIVRKRAGAQPIASLATYDPGYDHSFTLRPIDIILDERALELFAEGKRWEDLRRTKQLELYYEEFNNNAKDADVKWLRPIPTNEISANTGINEEDQNEGY